MVHSRHTGSAIAIESSGSTAAREIVPLPPAECT